MNNEIRSKDIDQGIVKHNNFIQCKYSLNLNEQKFLYKLFQYVQKNSITTTDLTLDFDEFFSDYKSVINKNITRKHFLELIISVQSNIPTIVRIDDNKFIKAAWFKIVGDLNFEKIELILDNDIYNYIKSQESEFTVISDSIYKLNTFYAMRIYEILKRWLAYCTKGNKPFIQNFNQFKEILMIDDESILQQFKLFNSKILKPSVKAINAVTDIFITYKAIKGRNRSIEAIEFNIEYNPNYSKVELPNPTNEGKEKVPKTSKNENTDKKDKIKSEEAAKIDSLYIPDCNIFNDRYIRKFKEYIWENAISFSEDGKNSSNDLFKDAVDIFIDNKGINVIKNLPNYKYFLGIFNNLVADDLKKFVKTL